MNRTGGVLRPTRQAPALIRAQIHGDDGVACLCAVEAAIADLWPAITVKELVWLTRLTGYPDQLSLRAVDAEGRALGDAAFDLAGDHGRI